MTKEEIYQKILEDFQEAEPKSHSDGTHTGDREADYWEGYCDALSWAMRLLKEKETE